MSREFIDAIENGDNLSAESEFSDVMMSKVGSTLEINRQELANYFVNEKVIDEANPENKAAKNKALGRTTGTGKDSGGGKISQDPSTKRYTSTQPDGTEYDADTAKREKPKRLATSQATIDHHRGGEIPSGRR